MLPIRISLSIFVAVAALTSTAFLGGCSDSPATASPADAGAAEGSLDSGPASCAAPTASPPWLDAALADRVSTLAGEVEVAPGVRLTDRATPERRQAARTYLEGELRALGLATTIEAYTGGANVVGRLAPIGEAAAEWIVVGAHFDTVANVAGANDNATGVAAVLAAARMLNGLPCRTRGVMIAFFDQEELSLLGSKAFAAAQQAAGTRIVAVHTVDQVGWDADGDRTFEIERPTAMLFAEYQAGAAAVGAKVVETKTTGSDHQAFRVLGFAAAGVTEEYVNGDTTPHFHDAGDRASTVQTAYHALAARLVAYVVARELGAQ